MTIISTTVGKKKKWSSHHSQQKSPKCSTWVQSQKQNDLCSFPTQTIQYHSNPSQCPNQECWRSWSWMVLWRPIRPSRTNSPKRCPFHYRALKCKSRSSRDTWSNRQIWPWSTKWNRAKANRVLSRECTGHSKHHLPTTKEKTTNGHHQMVSTKIIFRSDQISHSVVSDSLRHHESQHTRPPGPSPTPGVHSDSRPSSRWCHPAISSSVVPFSSCPQSLPASESSPMSQLLAWGGQSTGVSALASFLPKKSQGWSPSEWTGWMSLQSKGLSSVFSNTTVQKHEFFGAQPSSQSNSHIHTWPQEKP